MKGIDLRVRPVFHRDENRVRGHFFLCMLAYYVEWHMRRALAPLLFQDESVAEDRMARDPVARPQPSEPVRAKKTTKRTPDGLPVHSFRTLLAALATQARVTDRLGTADATFTRLLMPTPLHQKANDLLGLESEPPHPVAWMVLSLRAVSGSSRGERRFRLRSRGGDISVDETSEATDSIYIWFDQSLRAAA